MIPMSRFRFLSLAVLLVLFVAGVSGRSLSMQADGSDDGSLDSLPASGVAPLAVDGMKSIPCPAWADSSCTCYGESPEDPILLFHFCPQGESIGSPPDEFDCPWLALVMRFIDAADCTCYGGKATKLSCAIDVGGLPDKSTAGVDSQQPTTQQGEFTCPKWMTSIFTGDCVCYGDPDRPSVSCHGPVVFGANAAATVQSEVTPLLSSANEGQIECPDWITTFATGACVCYGVSKDSLSMVDCDGPAIFGANAVAQSEPVALQGSATEGQVECPDWVQSYLAGSCVCYGHPEEPWLVSCQGSTTSMGESKPITNSNEE